MSAPPDAPIVYAASVNPPRRAKRQRTGSVGDTPSSPTAPTTARPDPPQAAHGRVRSAVPDSDDASDAEDDYDPGRDAAPAPKRRGRKPGTMSRSARESLASSTIPASRRLHPVGERDQVVGGSDGVVAPPPAPVEDKGKKGKGKVEGGSEKEFKLDVLVKTVEYMQDLVARVQALEAVVQGCGSCRPRSVPLSPKRRREGREDDALEGIQRDARRLRLGHPTHPHGREEDDSYGGDDEHPSPTPLTAPSAPASTSAPTPTSSRASDRSTASPRLPPIASWLPHPYVDPSSLMSGPSPTRGPSPSGAPSARAPANVQLPSPPPSGRFRPTITLANMPALALPAPARPVQRERAASTTSHSQRPPSHQPHQHQQQQQQQQRKSISMSPVVSPTWTPEDESAASLLLQIGSKPRSASTSSTGSMALPMVRDDWREERGFAAPREVVTPSALLGMRD
ncbi:uncharacterized protein BXZ73DRAFT_90501 [Epithele typhae]|uniref:uncharacterized protein n=1 Tax=Epithele typhae TaxID=378194 RepID=UPI002008369C|nr:uncharacterized protein BXZ73DRAFT_90501 [Epithele typhae]KAH9929066.1 hypothetical protein BXZ73DRAFT_90501 [Epithele typhae]